MLATVCAGGWVRVEAIAGHRELACRSISGNMATIDTSGG